MFSTSTMAPNTTQIHCTTEWPVLSQPEMTSQESNGLESDWELLPETDESPAETSFDLVEPVPTEMEKESSPNHNSTKKTGSTEYTPHCLKHAASTPDFRHYDTILEESDDDTEGVLVEDSVGSLASSSIVMVPRPSSVTSSWSGSKISFRDAIMKESTEEIKDDSTTDNDSEAQVQQPKTLRKKPKFVVKPIRRCSKSTGDLQSLSRIAENDDHEGGDEPYDNDQVVGETDAELYYSRKAQGKLGRKNGRKIRPDEAKRLQITMAKKDDQRQRQQTAAAKKR